MKIRESILAQIKKDLRGKNDRHIVEFNYFGYTVKSYMYGVYANRIQCRYYEKEGANPELFTIAMPHTVTTIKASIDYFDQLIDFLDVCLKRRYEANRMNQEALKDYILHFDPLGVLE